ncbi:glycosyltransferase family 4 protein [Ginsengibacter hankyongi]|uniref:Glycosyltransferase family 4 protein n=1 Tax=Ginsengibacter hankyongi TaxID=2607284 RepID=A0A5J5ICH0_9BACT|nr:glycosyltransferase family 4 protein [Ginsengibacter hankyongi]KAA9036401.1 glycosyltransferase family 4 protein [Ginsengibacter hankyongi]
MKPKISYYLSHPIQYFSPLLREMSEEFDLHVYYFSDASIRGNVDVGFGQPVKWDIPLLEGYSATFLKNISGRKSLSNRIWDVVNPSVVTSLFKRDASIVIVNGWSYFSNLLTIIAAKMLGKKVWLRAENPLHQELKKSRNALRIKAVILKYLLFPFIDKFLYIGKESKQFFEYYGVKPSRLVYTPYAVDNELFQKESACLKNKELVKHQLGLPREKDIILFTGKYIEKKRPLDLIKAFHLLNASSAVLVMAGEGELRKEMEVYIHENDIKNVILAGFINQSEIARYYAAADVFVMCSGMGETWGLSVNEAMNFALPVIVSKTCGCAEDLVHDNSNGFLYEERDIKALSDGIRTLLENEELRGKFGNASLKIINDFSIQHIVQNMKAAI